MFFFFCCLGTAVEPAAAKLDIDGTLALVAGLSVSGAVLTITTTTKAVTTNISTGTATR